MFPDFKSQLYLDFTLFVLFLVKFIFLFLQEHLVELDLMDKLEYHTVQAVQKLDPYALLNM